MADYDAIVVGAGHNGLVCALYLARAGWRVLVVERSSEVGGGVRTAEVTLPGFRHDLYATNVSFFAGSPVYRELKPDFDRVGLRLITSPCPYASVHPGGALRVYADPGRTEQELAAHNEADAAGWRELSALYRRTAPKFLPLFFTMLPSWRMVRQLGRIATVGPADALRLMRIATQTPRNFVDAVFQSREAKGLVAAWAYHMDFAPDIRGGALFAFVAALSGFLRGLCLAEGGAGEITRALHRLLQAAGAEVVTETEITRIRVIGNKAVGVETAHGDRLGAGRAVIANTTPRHLFGKLIDRDALDPRFFQRAQNYRFGAGTFILHLALNGMPAWRAAADLGRFNYIHVCGSLEEIESTYRQCLAGLLPSRPLLVVSQTTPADPSRAPAGRHILRIHVRTVPSVILGDAADRIEARSWSAAKEPFAERLLDLVEAHAPDLRSRILASAATTHEEVEADNPNFVGGDCMAGSHHLDQNFFWRPLRGYSRYATPIEQLYMIGASTWPGAGVNGASGYLLAGRLSGRP
jgi:phytoene dehydrogenase-like protein